MFVIKYYTGNLYKQYKTTYNLKRPKYSMLIKNIRYIILLNLVPAGNVKSDKDNNKYNQWDQEGNKEEEYPKIIVIFIPFKIVLLTYEIHCTFKVSFHTIILYCLIIYSII